MTDQKTTANGKVSSQDAETAEHLEAGKWRRAAPQIIASTVKNLLLMDLGMTIAFSTIVIPVLLDGKDSKGLVFTEENASWFGSIIYACQPTGSVLSGLVLESLGRKYAMMAVNVPHILGWFLLYSAGSHLALYMAAMIMGLGVGFMEAPIITYIGEICEPRLRGTLTSYSNLFVNFGMTSVFVLGTLVDWRHAALICMMLPVLTILALTQVPETPLWLMAQGREEDARKSLQWLRGWVSPQAVQNEVTELKRYAEEAKKKKKIRGYDNPAIVLDENPSNQTSPVKTEKVPETVEVEKPSWMKKMARDAKDFFRPAVLKPFFFIIVFFFISNWTGISSTRPYLIKLIEEFKFPIEPYRASVIFGSIGFCASVMCMATIAWFRKRPIALISVFMCAFSGIGLAFTPSTALSGWACFILFVLLFFFSMYGASGIVWTVMSEIFPYRGRSQASGMAAASSYLITFSATKSFLALKHSLGLHNLFGVYGGISAFGFVFLYFMLPETEGKSLEEIENSYKKKKESQTESSS
uniref:Facilitated trehalose transporter Tret1 n=4 Tax=Lygus hesperus TaxID=30085 RepID=A0A0A9WSX5_LYGHE